MIEVKAGVFLSNQEIEEEAVREIECAEKWLECGGRLNAAYHLGTSETWANLMQDSAISEYYTKVRSKVMTALFGAG